MKLYKIFLITKKHGTKLRIKSMENVFIHLLFRYCVTDEIKLTFLTTKS